MAYHEPIKLSIEKRQDFYLIFKEAVNNLVKHAGASEARLRISLENQQMLMKVADNGAGFDPAAATERNGLRNMQSRAARLGGEIRFQTAPGQGTTLQLRFPVAV